MMQSIYTPKDVYECDGVTVEFPVTFPVDKATDLLVFLTTTATGATRRMVRNQDYTVREEDDVLTVVTRVTPTRPPWPAGIRLVILRRMQFTQPSGKSTINPRVFSNRIDSLTRIFQQVREKLDRTLHVGLAYPPFFKVSRPYAILFSDELVVESGGDSGLGMWTVIPEEVTMFAIPTGGELDVNKVVYDDWPPEELDIVASIPVDGELFDALLSYEDWPPEELDIVASVPITGGELVVALLTYSNYAAEEIDVVSIPTGGTLS